MNRAGVLRPFCAIVLAPLWVAACSGSGGSGTKPGTSGDQFSSLPRAIRVDEGKVVIEGRWHPIEVTAESPIVANRVRAVCVRAERRCREEVTTAPPGKAPVAETFDYRVSEWTKAKLVATRRAGASELQLRVSLTGLAAEKVVPKTKGDKDAGIRWRLE